MDEIELTRRERFLDFFEVRYCWLRSWLQDIMQARRNSRIVNLVYSSVPYEHVFARAIDEAGDLNVDEFFEWQERAHEYLYRKRK